MANVRKSWLLSGFLLAGLSGVTVAQSDKPGVELLGSVHIPGTTPDLSALSGDLETGTPVNALGGLSALDYTGKDNRYVVLADRGAGDGKASYPCRFHLVDLVFDSKEERLSFKLVSTTLLKDENNRLLKGGLAGLQEWDGSGRCPSLDPEGVRCLANDQLVVSDEYGPFINIFSREGKLIREIKLPEKFALSELRKPAFERGAFTNRGLEGIAVSPDQTRLVAAMQGPLVQDGRLENNKCVGNFTRWISISPSSSEQVEYAYPLDDEITGISEVLAVDANRYLVIERDSLIGAEAKFKRIYLADVSQASDISKIERLPSKLEGGVKPISKTLLIDLLDPKFGFVGEHAPEKPEGIAWGPRLPDGRRLLMLCFDNDCNPANDSIFAAFAVRGL